MIQQTLLNGITHEVSGRVSVSTGFGGAMALAPAPSLAALLLFFLAMTVLMMYEVVAIKVSPMRVAASTVM